MQVCSHHNTSFLVGLPWRDIDNLSGNGQSVCFLESHVSNRLPVQSTIEYSWCRLLRIFRSGVISYQSLLVKISVIYMFHLNITIPVTKLGIGLLRITAYPNPSLGSACDVFFLAARKRGIDDQLFSFRIF